jgi:transposase
MRIHYPTAIPESLDELTTREHHLRGHKAATRVRLLILLKRGHATTLSQAASLVGDRPTQVVRWWERYRAGGRSAVEREPVHPGHPPRVTPEARTDVEAAMRRGEIAPLEAARQYLVTHWGIAYQSINGIWWPFRRWRVRQKTGRRRHRRASAAQHETCKNTLPPR